MHNKRSGSTGWIILAIFGVIAGLGGGWYAHSRIPTYGGEIVPPFLDPNGIDNSPGTSQVQQVIEYEAMFGDAIGFQNFLRQVNSFTRTTDISVAEAILYGVGGWKDGIYLWWPWEDKPVQMNGQPVSWFDSGHGVQATVANDVGLGIYPAQVLQSAVVTDNQDFLPVIVGYEENLQPIIRKQSSATVTLTAPTCYNGLGVRPGNLSYTTTDDRGWMYKSIVEPIAWMTSGQTLSMQDDVVYGWSFTIASYNALAPPNRDGTRSMTELEKLYQTGLPNLQGTSGDLLDPNAYDLITYAANALAKSFNFREAKVVITPVMGEVFCGTGEKLIPDNLDALLRAGPPQWYQYLGGPNP